MDVVNAGATAGGGQIELPGGKWACALAFKQTNRQKNDRGIIVTCPKIARKYALFLLCYADDEEGIKRKKITITKSKEM